MDANRLERIFDAIIKGKVNVARPNYRPFLEAICSSPDVAGCISKLISSPKGLSSLQAATRIDLSPGFFNGPGAALLQYLSADALIDIGGGQYLRKVLLTIVDPPIFWLAFTQALRDGKLNEQAHASFAWLLLQLALLPDDQADTYLKLAEDNAITEPLLSSSSQIARKHAYKIRHIVDTRRVSVSVDVDFGPGGRHDNDFVDFREIAILPTADELDSLEKPFLRTTKVLDDGLNDSNRISTHLDNQFRLNREDMVYEMREESQIIRKLKQGKHRGFVLDRLRLVGIHFEDTEDRSYYRCNWGIKLLCGNDIWYQVKSKDFDARKKYITDNRNIIRHQAMACLIVDGQIIAFPRINRVVDLLAYPKPIIVLQLNGKKSTVKTLLTLKTAKQVSLLQIETAIFAYEPILKALQEKKSLPFSEELLAWTAEGSVVQDPETFPASMVSMIKACRGKDLGPFLGCTKKIELDEAQTQSLLSGLTQRVSLIQGPPGMSLFTGHSCILPILFRRDWKVVHWRYPRQIYPQPHNAEDSCCLLY